MDDSTGKTDGSKKPLTAKQVEAAVMVAEARITRKRIAEMSGIKEATLYLWLKNPLFRAKVAEKQKELDEMVTQYRFANKRERIAALNEQAEALDTIRKERALQAMKEKRSGGYSRIPGAKTGRIIPSAKMIGMGAAAKEIVEYVYDASVDKQFESTLTLIAKERGELTEKKEITGANGMPFITISNIVVALPDDSEKDDDDDD